MWYNNNKKGKIKMISDIGINIKRIRLKKNMSGRALSLKANINPSTVCNIEIGKSATLKADNLKLIAKALNVSVNELVGNDNIEKTNDIIEMLSFINRDMVLELDNIELSKEEKEMINLGFGMILDSARYKRKR